jgi:hypothetical protein
MIKTCKNQHIIDVVMKADYWRAVWINNMPYFRTFDENVIYHDCYFEQSYIDERKEMTSQDMLVR